MDLLLLGGAFWSFLADALPAHPSSAPQGDEQTDDGPRQRAGRSPHWAAEDEGAELPKKNRWDPTLFFRRARWVLKVPFLPGLLIICQKLLVSFLDDFAVLGGHDDLSFFLFQCFNPPFCYCRWSWIAALQVQFPGNPRTGWLKKNRWTVARKPMPSSRNSWRVLRWGQQLLQTHNFQMAPDLIRFSELFGHHKLGQTGQFSWGQLPTALTEHHYAVTSSVVQFGGALPQNPTNSGRWVVVQSSMEASK